MSTDVVLGVLVAGAFGELAGVVACVPTQSLTRRRGSGLRCVGTARGEDDDAGEHSTDHSCTCTAMGSGHTSWTSHEPELFPMRPIRAPRHVPALVAVVLGWSAECYGQEPYTYLPPLGRGAERPIACGSAHTLDLRS